MQDEVRTSVGDHDVSSDFVPSDLDDIQFHWENPNVEKDAVYRPGIDTPFSPSLFGNFPEAGSADYPFEIDDEQDKENEYPTSPESQRPTQPPPLHRSLSCPFRTRLENIPNAVYRSFLRIIVFILRNQLNSSIHNFFFISAVMFETIAKVVVALIFVMTVSLFIYHVKTTEKVGQNLDPYAKAYKDY